ncbi:MAG: glycosyltransferase, partial [Planctomycetota bacterium]
MKVLMLGWEFPPFISGGLGTACYGLTRGLSRMGTEILFVLPRPVPASHTSHVRLLGRSPKPKAPEGPQSSGLDNVRFCTLPVALDPYARPLGSPPRSSFATRDDQREATLSSPSRSGRERTVQSREGKFRSQGPLSGHYGSDLFGEVDRYAELVCRLAGREDFDVVHAHDWMTFPAGIAITSLRRKPLVVHVHSTEFDRSGWQVNRRIYDIERRGMRAAATVIAVSNLTRNTITSCYGIAP